MEECKRMGIKVLGPDVNESLKGFAVNSRGEIRFGLGGLKGAGDAAVDFVIEERKKNGVYKDIWDFSERTVGRSVNKKSLETFAYSGAFDCFTELHRAQYFYMPEGDRISGLERVIHYGQTKLAASGNNTNNLFGDTSSAMDIPKPKIAPCNEWTLTEKLDHEKEVTGMFMSGHPLDHYKFELMHYGIMQLEDFNEIKESTTLTQSNAGKVFKIAGLVTGAQHRTTKTGKSFGILGIEDYSGKCELALFGEDYMKFKIYLETGKSVYITGFFKAPWKEGNAYEFKVNNIYLLETVKPTLTKGIDISLTPEILSNEFVNFISTNSKQYPGKTTLKINVYEPDEDLKISLYTNDKGITMNDELAEFLVGNVDIDVKVLLN
jgi:DNA polymerase-3 subunit alpha